MNVAAELARRIDEFLPQTQCAECGEPSCRAYAEAVAAGKTGIDQCPPGGAATAKALARLLGRPPVESPPESPSLQLAFIREADCIGCKLCIDACPVDCIVGAPKLMHTVIARECSGCRLCLPVCPTDCIEMADPPPDYAAGAPGMWMQFSHAQVQKFRRRAQAKRKRDADRQARRDQREMQRRRDALRAEIQAAVARVRGRQAQCQPTATRQFVGAPATVAPSPTKPSQSQ